ncbi:hypothetical protein N657DRAFT_636402 [Parathielavia appendiculata]|uniref:Uncharacterized protein n=1 Tax=Parathielavia appendiculata TaxID=2587402 RepID=A0AAN6TTY4_9PEZI|nr:hypothetical protein N657DRAFT_636402 [Parathielavia appendiculata]
MSSFDSSTPNRTPQPCTLVRNVHIPDSDAEEMDLASQPWALAIVIEDDDLMFGGKPLCAWYEEDKRMLSTCIAEEENRGRQRQRVCVENHRSHKDQHQRQTPKPASTHASSESRQ